MSLRNFLEIRLDRNKNVNNEIKSFIFLDDKIMLDEQNGQEWRNKILKYSTKLQKTIEQKS